MKQHANSGIDVERQRKTPLRSAAALGAALQIVSLKALAPRGSSIPRDLGTGAAFNERRQHACSIRPP
jgi:hypothetical protein